MLRSPSGMLLMVMFPSLSDTAVMSVPSTLAVTPMSVSPFSLSFTVAFSVFWALAPCAHAVRAVSANMVFSSFLVFVLM